MGQAVDNGIWFFECSECGHPFEIELTEQGRILDYAKSYPCPSCAKVPSAPPETPWHHITGFKAVTPGG